MSLNKTESSVRFLYREGQVWYTIKLKENSAELEIIVNDPPFAEDFPSTVLDKLCFELGARNKYNEIDSVRVVSDSRKAIKCMKEKFEALKTWDPEKNAYPAIRGSYWNTTDKNKRLKIFTALRDAVSTGNVEYKKTLAFPKKLSNYFRKLSIYSRA